MIIANSQATAAEILCMWDREVRDEISICCQASELHRIREDSFVKGAACGCTMTPHIQCRGLSVHDIAVVAVGGGSGASTAQGARQTWMGHLPNAMVARTMGGQLAGSDHIEAMARLKRKYPGKKWYILCDDDALLLLHNLVCYLSQMSHNEKMMIGTHHCQGGDFQCERTSVKAVFQGWTCGGPGIVLSGALANSIDFDRSLQWYRPHWTHVPPAADVALNCAVADHWSNGHITHYGGFFRNGPGQSECECILPDRQMCTWDSAHGWVETPGVVAFHHLPPDRMRSLWETEKTLHEYSATSLYTEQQNLDQRTVDLNHYG